LTISEVRDSHPRHSFESRFIVRNIGKLPAYRVWANTYDLEMKVRTGLRITGSTLVRNGPPVSRLDPDEAIEVPVIPQVHTPPGLPIDSCTYRLELEYRLEILRFGKTLTRSWKVELRNFEDSFTWQYTSL